MGNERFEKLAEDFYKESGMMAPGKDDCLATHTREERHAAWDQFMQKVHCEGVGDNNGFFEFSVKTKEKEHA